MLVDLSRPVARRSRLTKLAAAALWSVFAALTSVYVYMAVALPGGPDGMSDLHVYVGAVQTMLGGGSLYDFASFNGDRFLYPPFAGLAFAPFLAMPEPVLRVAWTLLQCAEAAVLAWAVAAQAPVVGSRTRPHHGPKTKPCSTDQAPQPHAGSTRQPSTDGPTAQTVLGLAAQQPGSVVGTRVPGYACLLLLTQPVFTGIFLGQVSLLITLLALLDALDLTPRALRGVPTGVAAAIKLTPLAFIPYLWMTGRSRAAATAAGTFMLCTVAAGLAAPADSVRFWGSALSAPDFVNLAQADNQSIHGFLARMGWTGLGGAAVAVAVAVAVTWLGYRRSRHAHRGGQTLAGAVIVGAMVVVLSPISWSHHQTTLVIAAACVVGWRLALLRRIWPLACYALMTIPYQWVLPDVWPSGVWLTDNLGLLLALVIACAVPFVSPESSPRPAASRVRA